MSKIIILLISLLAYGCALTAPKGTQELLEDIKRDKSNDRNPGELFVGKPIFIKVRAYPRVEESNIYGKHWVLMKIGNEKIDVVPMLNEINGEN